ncbi:hypothetical protein OLZ33_22770 [Pantoea ananatis]|uniref:DUF4297 family anti-phage-associated protein n=1 Tax=Pantoea ananas TaxID=553 RepID=UPI0022215C4E|nr:DUF4297 family anti-phage-associated protein [Pantoea ananatis]MCW1834787.1 hypothetical protein [Pantoea ananatis]
MTDRSAVNTIRGYFYQFDLTILSILKLESLDHAIEVECVEDIDIHTADDITATQCKYYAKTEYNHSIIKDAIKHMLSHFKETLLGSKPKVSYSIYGYYLSGHEKLNLEIDVEFLKKNFLTYTLKDVKYYHHKDLKLSDSDLSEFLRRLTININAEEFDVQFQNIIESLQNQFEVTKFTAEYFFYNNALSIIRSLAIQETKEKRLITKKDFLEKINTSSILFNEWFIQKKGIQSHFSRLRKEYFTELNISPFERFFLIEIENSSYMRYEIKNILFEISRKWSKLSKREPNPFCPYVYIHGLAHDELVSLKGELAIENFKIIDGHDFNGAQFSIQSMISGATYGNGIKLKLINTLDNLQQVIGNINKTRRIYQFHINDHYFDYNNPSVQHIKIQLKKTSDINSII